MGCTHGCIYCDSRSEIYQINHKFEDIEVKINASELLENALRKKKSPIMVGTGSMCDPYMHIESELMLTRKCLQIIEKYGFGATVITKSKNVLRDMDLYKSINKKSRGLSLHNMAISQKNHVTANTVI
jgi:DNA repair photolyase